MIISQPGVDVPSDAASPSSLSSILIASQGSCLRIHSAALFGDDGETMRLLKRADGNELSLTDDLPPDKIPRYAILSHTWGPDSDEATDRDLIDGTGKDKFGYKKIQLVPPSSCGLLPQFAEILSRLGS